MHMPQSLILLLPQMQTLESKMQNPKLITLSQILLLSRFHLKAVLNFRHNYHSNLTLCYPFLFQNLLRWWRQSDCLTLTTNFVSQYRLHFFFVLWCIPLILLLLLPRWLWGLVKSNVKNKRKKKRKTSIRRYLKHRKNDA